MNDHIKYTQTGGPQAVSSSTLVPQLSGHVSTISLFSVGVKGWVVSDRLDGEGVGSIG